VAALQKRMQDADAAAKKKHAELDATCKQQTSDSKTKHEKEVAALQKQMQDADAAAKKKHAELDATCKKQMSETKERHQKEIDTYMMELEKMEAGCKDQLEEMAKRARTLQQTVTKEAHSQAQKRAQEAVMSEISLLKAEVAKHKSEVTRLKSQLDENGQLYYSQLTSVMQSDDEGKKSLKKAKAEAEMYKAELERIKEELKDCSEQQQKSLQQNEELRSRIESGVVMQDAQREAAMTQMQHALNECKRDLVGLKTIVEEQEIRLEEQTSARQKIYQEWKSSVEKERMTDQRLRQMEEQNALLSAELEKLRSLLADASLKLSESGNIIVTVHEEARAHIENREKSLNTEIGHLNRALCDSKQKQDNMEKEVLMLRSQLRDCQRYFSNPSKSGSV
jgi:chromosome segregation ATPase